MLLTLGFYLQTWVVFPAIGQFLFLVLHGRENRWRFHANLALCYALVLAATVHYLLTHLQKAQVGRWGTTTSKLWPQLSDGFHLVLAGHVAGRSGFTDFLFWFWLAIVGLALGLLVLRRPSGASPLRDYRDQSTLMLLCSGVSLAFQIGYFLEVENLSVWPRYFVIHYFFLVWLIALVFKELSDLRSSPQFSIWTRRALTTAVAALLTVMVASGIFQISSYARDPYLDTGMSPTSNWRNVTAAMAGLGQPGDVILYHDYIIQATLTFTRPHPYRFELLDNLEKADLGSPARLVYLETSDAQAERDQLTSRLSALGFSRMEVLPLRNTHGEIISYCRLLAFQRR